MVLTANAALRRRPTWGLSCYSWTEKEQGCAHREHTDFESDTSTGLGQVLGVEADLRVDSRSLVV